ncbi:type II secretion system F family protein [Stygiolobus caldivivus]|uniref:Flagellar assembly protein n=1 Tax=Stygiolobus caldivivus TaxID=2824673 RepID=A0A8D5U4N8_9CREN|nr:type II secretion system F family protein [Stygiolobus caldivivus]BCU69020.1 flagellar assembly protein [Stygiolobus caldivivus]
MAISIGKKKSKKGSASPTPKSNYSQIDLMFYKSSLAKSLAKSFEKKLKQAGLPDDPRVLASRLLFFMIVALVAMVALWVIGIIGIRDFVLTREPKYAVFGIMGFIFGTIIPPVTYLVFNLNISQKIDSRRIGIEAETPAFAALFLVFLRSGLSPKILFENISKTKAFSYINGVSKYIVKRMNYLGESVERAVDSSIRVVPSKLYEELMSTYITAIVSGAPVYETMSTKVKDIIKRIELLATVAADRLSGVGEGYVTWLASGFITIYLILILESVFTLLQLLPLPIIGILVVVFVPMVNVLFIFAVDSLQFKFPEKPLKADKLFLEMIPVGFILGIILMIALEPLMARIFHYPLIAPQFLVVDMFTLSGTTYAVPATVVGLTLGFIIALVPPTIMAQRELNEGTGYDIYVVRLLRAIGEGVRAGLSPETIIKNLKENKEMGKLQSVLRRLYAYIRLGMPVKDAFRKASQNIIDFPTKVAFNSLADMVEIGSLTPESVEILADQLDSQIRIRNEYYSKIKVLLYMPYIGSILALITSVILSSAILSLISTGGYAFTYGPLAVATALVPKAIYMTALSSVFNSMLAGLLVGKLARGRIANGYKHAIILLVITMVLLIMTLLLHFSFVSSQAPTL